MAHKELKYDQEARTALEAGVDAVANAVKVTLGPQGRYVVLDKKFGAPTITNDGVTIAREIEVEDVFQNQGAQLVREVGTARRSAWTSSSPRACSSTRATSRRTWSPTRTAWRPCSRTRTSSSPTPRSAPCVTSCPCSSR